MKAKQIIHRLISQNPDIDPKVIARILKDLYALSPTHRYGLLEQLAKEVDNWST